MSSLFLELLLKRCYTNRAWNLCFFISGVGFQDEAALCFLDSIPAVYGIAAMLINVRVGLQFTQNNRVPAPVAAAVGTPSATRAYLSTLVVTAYSTRNPQEESVDCDTRSMATSVSSMTAAQGACPV